jgi:ligand-binding SRPBCC domain-containing protein
VLFRSIYSIENSNVEGFFNLVSPHSVTQKVFIERLAKERHVPFVMSVPKFVISLVLGEMSQVVISSQNVSPKKMLEVGFRFEFDQLEKAFQDIYKNEDYLVQDYTVSQYVPDKVENVFDFFSAAKNLEEITPDFLNFKVKNMSSEFIQKDTIINYKLKIHGFPVYWQTQIIEWEPLKKFIDYQNKGPYSLWHHTHTFTTLQNGTLIEDRIKYQIPGHIFGLLFLGYFIRKDVSQIFNYRIKSIQKKFKG